MKKFLSASVLSFSLVIGATSIVSADFNDVPESYWAYSEITDITSRGYMTADMSGNFNPKNYIDKFDTAKILSLASGYNGNDEASEVYEANKELVEEYKSKFSKWNATADDAIIYLLGKGIFKSEDLAQFVVTNSESKEQLRALSREEYAVFLVRLMGKEKEAQEYTSDYKFTDDDTIAQSRKNSVYYLKSIGIISGNTDGKYSPKSAVTRAEFCFLLSRAIEQMPEEQKSEVSQQPTAEVKTTSTTIIGTIDNIFPSLNVIQVRTNNETSLYKIKSDAVITANGYTASFDSIKIGMAMSAIVDDYEISALNASGSVETLATEVQSESAEPSTEATTETVTEVSTEVITETSTESSTEASVKDVQTYDVYGIVESADMDKIKVISYGLSEYFAVEKEKITGTPASDISVMRNGDTIAFADIQENEPIKITTDGEKIYSAQLLGSACIFNGAKIIKTYTENNILYFMIKSADGGIYSFATNDETVVTRNGSIVKPSAVTAGDKAAVTVKDGKITAVAAIIADSSVLSNMYVAQLHFGQNYSCIALSEKEDLSDPELYSVSTDSVNPYLLKVGDKVRVGLEGTDITTLEIKDRNEENSYTGIITGKKTSVITLSCFSELSSPKAGKVSYDTDTRFYDSTTGKDLKFSDLEENMLIYVTYEDDLDEETIPVAKSITVLKRK